MTKRGLSVLLALSLVLALMPAVAPHVHAEEHTCVDDDSNGYCDACSYCMGEHSFDGSYFHIEDDYHYSECDYCYYYDPDSKAAHAYDGESDYFCNACDYNRCPEHDYQWAGDGRNLGLHQMRCSLCGDADSWLDHVDDGGDGICDVCGSCADHVGKALVWDAWNPNEHFLVCQTCGADDGWEDHYDGEDEGTVCDGCEFILTDCTHEDLEYRFDATGHWTDCKDCEQTVFTTCAHSYDNQLLYSDSDGHYVQCDGCYYYLKDEGEAHNYAWAARSMTGHTLYCERCYYEKREPHDFQNGACTACNIEEAACREIHDVYVGGVGLTAGQYLDNDGNVSDAKPDGGYAYYKEGVLELNNYVYEGPGFAWVEYTEGEPDQASVCATVDLTLVLKGENILETLPNDGAVGMTFCSGIIAEGDLTVRGDGSLTEQGNNEGIWVASGNLTIEGGTLTIDAGNRGFSVDSSITVSGGTVTVTAGADGFAAGEDITISGGTITVDAECTGMACNDGSVTISGGTVAITSASQDGIFTYAGVNISGGSVSIEAEMDGIYSDDKDVTITGGELVVHGRYMNAISAGRGNVAITGGNLKLTSGVGMVVFANEKIIIENFSLPEGVKVTEDEYGQYIEIENGETLSLLTPFSAELQDDGIHLTGRPWGLQILFAAYNTEGKMIDLQLVKVSSDQVKVPAGGTYTAFFLNSRCAPVYEKLPISK